MKTSTTHNLIYNEIKDDSSSKQEEDQYMAESLSADLTLQRDSNQPSTGKAVMER